MGNHYDLMTWLQLLSNWERHSFHLIKVVFLKVCLQSWSWNRVWKKVTLSSELSYFRIAHHCFTSFIAHKCLSCKMPLAQKSWGTGIHTLQSVAWSLHIYTSNFKKVNITYPCKWSVIISCKILFWNRYWVGCYWDLKERSELTVYNIDIVLTGFLYGSVHTFAL